MVGRLRFTGCAAIHDFQGWKLYHYGIFGDVGGMKDVLIINPRIADAQVGIGWYSRGSDNPLVEWEENKKFSQQNEKASTIEAINRGAHPTTRKLFVKGGLFVGRSLNGQICERGIKVCTLAKHPCVHGVATSVEATSRSG